MCRRFWFVLALITLTALPASAQAPPEKEVLDKIKLAHTHPATLLTALRVMPAGVSGVLAYPLDKALIVRATAPALAEMKAALQVVDVPLQEGRRLVMALRRGNPDAVRAAALALPHAGTVQPAGEKILRFDGDPAWLRTVQGVVFAAELTETRPTPLLVGKLGAGETRAELPAPIVEIVLPDGEIMQVSADTVALGDNGETRLEGNVTITLAKGIQLRTRHARVVLSRPGPGGQVRASIESVPPRSTRP